MYDTIGVKTHKDRLIFSTSQSARSSLDPSNCAVDIRIACPVKWSCLFNRTNIEIQDIHGTVFVNVSYVRPGFHMADVMVFAVDHAKLRMGNILSKNTPPVVTGSMKVNLANMIVAIHLIVRWLLWNSVCPQLHEASSPAGPACIEA